MCIYSGYKCSFCEKFNKIGQVAFLLALKPHNDNKGIQTYILWTTLGSGDLKTNISVTILTSMFYDDYTSSIHTELLSSSVPCSINEKVKIIAHVLTESKLKDSTITVSIFYKLQYFWVSCCLQGSSWIIQHLKKL